MSVRNHDNCRELTNSTEAFSSDHPNSIPFILWNKYKSNGSMKLKHLPLILSPVSFVEDSPKIRENVVTFFLSLKRFYMWEATTPKIFDKSHTFCIFWRYRIGWRTSRFIWRRKLLSSSCFLSCSSLMSGSVYKNILKI